MRTAEHTSRTRAVAAAVARVFRRTGIKTGAWFWGAYLLYAVGLMVGFDLAGNDLETSAFDILFGSSRWPVLVIGVMAPQWLLAMHLSAGGTRRALYEGIVRGALVVGAGFGTMTTIALLGERVLAESLGMTWRRLGGMPFDGVAGVATTLLGESFVIATYALVGAGIGFAFRSHGGARGALLSIAVVIPAALVDLVTRTGVLGVAANVRFEPDIENAVVPTSEGVVPMLVGLGGALVAVVLAAAVLRYVVRDASVNPPR